MNMLRLCVSLEEIHDDRLTKKGVQMRTRIYTLKDIGKIELWNSGGSQISLNEFVGCSEEKLMYKFSLKESKEY